MATTLLGLLPMPLRILGSVEVGGILLLTPYGLLISALESSSKLSRSCNRLIFHCLVPY